MGTWGVKLYQNDIGLDTKGDLTEYLRKGMSTQEAADKLIESNAAIIESEDDVSHDFWFAFADTLWQLGRLLPSVRDKAIELIDAGSDQIFREYFDKKLEVKRAAVISELRERLLSPQPPEKVIRPYRIYHCEWKIGDTYAYLLEGESAEERNLSGRYIILTKVDEGICYPEHIVPICTVKITSGSSLPETEEEVIKLEDVMMSKKTWGKRERDEFNEMGIFSDEVKKREYFDENNYLTTYRVELSGSTSKRAIPKKLIYLGNFPKVRDPNGAYIAKPMLGLASMGWKKFEEQMIQHYCWFNRKEAKLMNRGKFRFSDDEYTICSIRKLGDNLSEYDPKKLEYYAGMINEALYDKASTPLFYNQYSSHEEWTKDGDEFTKRSNEITRLMLSIFPEDYEYWKSELIKKRDEIIDLLAAEGFSTENLRREE